MQLTERVVVEDAGAPAETSYGPYYRERLRQVREVLAEFGEKPPEHRSAKMWRELMDEAQFLLKALSRGKLV
jgi:hypothetical protein